MKTIILLIALLCTSPLYAGIDELINSTARVITPQSVGTAFVFNANSKSLWLLTAGHVVIDEDEKKNDRVYLQFFIELKPSPLIMADVVNFVHKKNSVEDLAVLKIDKAKWPKYSLPSPIHLSNELSKKHPIFSYGAADGAEPSGFKGYFTDEDEYPDGVTFFPIPRTGRSGSGIFQEFGKTTKCVGVLILTGKSGVATPYTYIEKKLDEWGIKY